MIHHAAALKIQRKMSVMSHVKSIKNNLDNGILNIMYYGFDRLMFEYNNVEYLFEEDQMSYNGFRITYVRDAKNYRYRQPNNLESKKLTALLFQLHRTLYKSKQLL